MAIPPSTGIALLLVAVVGCGSANQGSAKPQSGPAAVPFAPPPAEPNPEPSPAAPSADLGGWTLGPDAAAPLAGVWFPMSFEQAWHAAPELRPAMSARFLAKTYEDVHARIPEMGGDLGGGDRWNEYWRRDGEWTTRAGAQWELRFSPRVGLTMITARFSDEAELRAAVAHWGEPDASARWDFWFDESSGTRAAITGDYNGHYHLEFMPYQSADEFLGQLFPEGKTLIGRAEDELEPVLGPGLKLGDQSRYQLVPLPPSLWMLAEVQFDTGSPRRVTAYRAPMSYTYDINARVDYERGLAKVLGPQTRDDGCMVSAVDGQSVRVCDSYSTISVTVGEFP